MAASPSIYSSPTRSRAQPCRGGGARPRARKSQVCMDRSCATPSYGALAPVRTSPAYVGRRQRRRSDYKPGSRIMPGMKTAPVCIAWLVGLLAPCPGPGFPAPLRRRRARSRSRRLFAAACMARRARRRTRARCSTIAEGDRIRNCSSQDLEWWKQNAPAFLQGPPAPEPAPFRETQYRACVSRGNPEVRVSALLPPPRGRAQDSQAAACDGASTNRENLRRTGDAGANW